MAAAAMYPTSESINGASHLSSTNGQAVSDYDGDLNYENTAEEENSYQRSAPKSESNKTSSAPGRSFSARARHYPADDPKYNARLLDTPPVLDEESTTPRGLPPNSFPPDADVSVQKNSAQPIEAAPVAVSSPLSRSNTTHSTNSQRPDFASDRSPLQKLEFTLNGITKEEKRARVQEAEAKARERIARQKAEREKAEANAAAPAAATSRNIQPESRAVQKAPQSNSTRKQAMIQSAPRAIQPLPRQPPGPAARHNRAVSMNPQTPNVRPPDPERYALAEAVAPQTARMGTVHRRAVTMSSGPSKPTPAGGNVQNVRPVSQRGPPKPVPAQVAPPATVSTKAVALMGSDERLETPPAARGVHGGSVDSHTKSKKNQSVSFDMPPPTPPPIFEWKNAPVARLGPADFDFQNIDMDRSKAWWEGGGTSNRRESRALPKNYKTPAQKLTGEILFFYCLSLKT